MNTKQKLTLVGVGVVAILLIIISTMLLEMKTVKGNQLGIKETWNGGVSEDVLTPKTYFLFPGVGQTIYTYMMSPQVWVMNDDPSDERSGGRPHDVFESRASDNQTMRMSLALQWHFDPEKLVSIHKTYGAHTGVKDWDGIIEDRLIRQVVMRIVATEATKYKAIDAYSGDGFVKLQTEITTDLMAEDGELRQQGVIIESFVIEKIELDPKYISEIEGRQVAQQKTLRMNEEERAALAEAEKAKAEAMADYEKRVVEAERDKAVLVLASEAAAEQQINQANAEAQRVVLAATASRDAALLEAESITALGAATAQAKELELSAWAVEGAESFIQVKVAEQMAEAFKGIQGYLPSDMNITILSENFMSSVRNLMRPTTTPPAPVR